MEINRALTLLYSNYDHFDSLPDHMSTNINKNDFLIYLQNDNQIDDKAIETFLNLIYDENEENRENIPRNNFNNKYRSLLKIIQDNDDSIAEVVNEKEIDNQLQTPKKDAPIVELGSPIAIKNSNHKMNNDLSLEAIELFKDIKFKDEKRNKQKQNYDSIVRPSNNFNFNTNNTPILHINEALMLEPNTKQSPRNNNNNEDKDGDIPKADGHAPNSNKAMMFKSSGLNYMNNQLKGNMVNTPNKAYSIQQKIQDVYQQILKPSSNDYNQYNISPVKIQHQFHHQNHHNHNHNHYGPMTGIISSNSPILNEDYFSKIYKEINSTASTKSINRKVNQFINKEKRNELFQQYTRVNKITLNQKFEGLNKLIHLKSNDNNGNKLLNEDDFVSLEDKISQFSLNKKGLGVKSKDNDNKNNDDNNNDAINNDIDIGVDLNHRKDNVGNIEAETNEDKVAI